MQVWFCLSTTSLLSGEDLQEYANTLDHVQTTEETVQKLVRSF